MYEIKLKKIKVLRRHTAKRKCGHWRKIAQMLTIMCWEIHIFLVSHLLQHRDSGTAQAVGMKITKNWPSKSESVSLVPKSDSIKFVYSVCVTLKHCVLRCAVLCCVNEWMNDWNWSEKIPAVWMSHRSQKWWANATSTQSNIHFCVWYHTLRSPSHKSRQELIHKHKWNSLLEDWSAAFACVFV